MGLFTPELYRSLALGFALGAVAVFTVLEPKSAADSSGSHVVPAAVAAPVK